MRVVLAQPRGFCAGVVRAIDIVERALEKYGEPCPDAMVESALNHAKILDDLDFREYKISVKASDPFLAVAAYQQMMGMQF